MRTTQRMMIGVTALVLVAGCVTVPSTVVPVGKDTYQLSMTGVGFAKTSAICTTASPIDEVVEPIHISR